MIKLFSILWNSFKLALSELNANKLRTILSLLGVSFGIFCIIGVLATIDSLKSKIQGDIKQVGSNCIYLDKWEYGGGQNYPWWKYIARPVCKINELHFIREKSSLAGNIAFFCSQNGNASYGNNILSNLSFFGTTEEFYKIQSVETQCGRYLSEAEFIRGTPSVIIGNEVATQLYGSARLAVGKEITFGGRKLEITGVIKKQGQSFANVWDFDNAIITSYNYFAGLYNPDKSNPAILIQGKEGVTTKA
jgi:putative ABC transport system permease protein